MAAKKINVLVYAGAGSTLESVRHCLYSLRRLLSSDYAVRPITGDVILKEPWLATCALLVIPGGADLGYCKTLNGEGNRRVKQYINNGGSYLGLCGGGYYGSSKCEFAVGNKELEVVGERELKFFPGIARGPAFSGFHYNSESGTRAAELRVEKLPFSSSGGIVPEVFRTYFNGGPVFIDAQKYSDKVEVLATYTEDLSIADPGSGAAAAVLYCRIGEGNAILTGPHPEFAATNLNPRSRGLDPKIVTALLEDDKARADFLKACLLKLGLQVNQKNDNPPSLSRIHISCQDGWDISAITAAWQSDLATVDKEDYIKGEHDTFHIEKPSSAWSMTVLAETVVDAVKQAVPGVESGDSQELKGELIKDQEGDSEFIDYDKITKKVIVHSGDVPAVKETPYFNHHTYYASLRAFQPSNPAAFKRQMFGRYLMYGEVVTSTSTLLEKNPKLTKHLPDGTVFIATTQLTGRGRGSNVWVSPAGALMFSFVLRHPLALNATAPVVFVQYLAALAIVEGIQTYDETTSSSSRTRYMAKGSPYRAMPVRLKWPNDIYAIDPSKGPNANKNDPNSYAKIGGILVNSSYSGGDYTCVVGIGLNVANAAPTTSLNAAIEAINAAPSRTKGPEIAPYTIETLLPRILSTFSSLYSKFCSQGFAGELEQLYYSHWLHTDQIVTLEMEDGVRAQIKGVTTDFGLLVAEEVTETAAGQMRGTGRKFALQSDSNSFDFFRGLLKRKI